MYEHCAGVGHRPADGSVVEGFTRPGQAAVFTTGQCSRCGRRTKLRTDGRIWPHKSTRRGQGMNVRSLLDEVDRRRYDQVSDLLGPAGAEALAELAEAVWQAARERQER
jgi:hypothetical protein